MPSPGHFLSRYTKTIFTLCFLVLATQSLLAHTVVSALKTESAGASAFKYLCLGYTHILPLGTDHILFIISLCLLNPGLKSLLWQATAFTVAHMKSNSHMNTC